MRKLKSAEMGMGTLIMFIAMILTSAIVSAVIISTQQSVKSKSYDTVKTTENDIGTSMLILEISADDGTDGYMEYYFTTIKLIAGSNSFRLRDTLVQMILENLTSNFEFNETINCSRKSDLDGNPTKYGVFYQLTSNSLHKNGQINTGEVARLCFKAPRPIGEQENVKIIYVPYFGKAWDIRIRMPNLIRDNRTVLFP
jgi:archaellin